MRRYPQVVILLWLLLSLLMLPTPSHAASLPQEGDDATLRVINESEKTICAVYISPLTSDEWGDNWLNKKESIPPEESHTFDIASGDYAILLTDCGGNKLLEKKGATVGNLYTLRFTGSAPSQPLQDANATLRVINESEETICAVYISPLTSDEWGDSWLDKGETIPPGESRAFDIASGDYALLLTDCDDNELMEKHSVTVGDLHTLRFTGSANFVLSQNSESTKLREIREGVLLTNIGLIYENRGEYAKAIDYYEQALIIFQEINYQAGESNTLINIGIAYRSLKQYPEALKRLNKALSIAQASSNREVEGTALHNIGFIYGEMGQYYRAINHYKQALAIFREIDYRTGEEVSLNSLGAIHLKGGQYIQALGYYQQLLAINRYFNDREGESNTLNNIGLIYNYQYLRQNRLL